MMGGRAHPSVATLKFLWQLAVLLNSFSWASLMVLGVLKANISLAKANANGTGRVDLGFGACGSRRKRSSSMDISLELGTSTSFTGNLKMTGNTRCAKDFRPFRNVTPKTNHLSSFCKLYGLQYFEVTVAEGEHCRGQPSSQTSLDTAALLAYQCLVLTVSQKAFRVHKQLGELGHWAASWHEINEYESSGQDVGALESMHMSRIPKNNVPSCPSSLLNLSPNEMSDFTIFFLKSTRFSPGTRTPGKCSSRNMVMMGPLEGFLQ